jgi:ATP-dependent Clp protease adaptor protein ClpS
MPNDKLLPVASDQNDGDSQGAVITKERVRTKRPAMFRVLLLNDDYTPMDFVIEVLRKFFNKSQAEATEIMLAVHTQGRGICGVYSYQVAETKVAQVTEAARAEEHPLQCTMEKA